MGTAIAKIRRASSGAGSWYPRKIVRTDGYVPFEIYSFASGVSGEIQYAAREDLVGYLWVNKASLVGSGGTAFTITDGTSIITVTE
jgi:hypothetical protein